MPKADTQSRFDGIIVVERCENIYIDCCCFVQIVIDNLPYSEPTTMQIFIIKICEFKPALAEAFSLLWYLQNKIISDQAT